jgi:hypothetical protein
MDMRTGGMTRNGMPDEAMIGASINVPIWRDRYRAAEREAKARRLAAMQAANGFPLMGAVGYDGSHYYASWATTYLITTPGAPHGN